MSDKMISITSPVSAPKAFRDMTITERKEHTGCKCPGDDFCLPLSEQYPVCVSLVPENETVTISKRDLWLALADASDMRGYQAVKRLYALFKTDAPQE